MRKTTGRRAAVAGKTDQDAGPKREVSEPGRARGKKRGRFRRQQVDEPVEASHEGYWDRFRRQQVGDPVQDRRARRRSL
jgi:hypothetical protein